MTLIKLLFGKTHETRSLRKKISARFRFFTEKYRDLPNFLVIGTQKGGTTSLYRYLSKHPQILGTLSVKELSFFDEFFLRGIHWYKSNFRFKRKNKLSFEATTHYLFNPNSAARVYETIPDVKIIVLLRDPIYRAFSHYQHQKRIGREYLDFPEAIRMESSRLKYEKNKLINNLNYQSYRYQQFSYLERGKYADQLNVWFKSFPKNNFLILSSEYFFSETKSALTEICNFLEIKDFNFKSKKRYNSISYSEEIDKETFAFLQGFFKEENKKLFKLLGKKYNEWG